MEQQNIILYNTPDGKGAVALYAKDGSLWLNQNQLAELFTTSKQNISLHIVNILKENELDSLSVVKDYLTTASDDKEYKVTYYSLEMIMSIGFRVKSKRGTQFRQWANRNLREYLVKGFVMDDMRLKNPNGRPDYFDEFLARIRDIRASEKRFYQKVRDLFALCSDYDSTDKSTQMFFAGTQNKLLFAVTKQTAAEIVINRADANAPNMGLMAWKGTVVRKQDIYIAKNYLYADELDELNRLVTIFLESAELRVKNRLDITMNYWKENVDKLIAFNDRQLLQGNGSITNTEMEAKADEVFEDFAAKRKLYESKAADEDDLQQLRLLEEKVKYQTTKNKKL